MRLWVDTNSARSVTDLSNLARLARAKGVQIAIHPQVYLERRRQMRAECTKEGRGFSAAIFDGFLGSEKIVVLDFVFDKKTAAAWADELDQRYPTDDAWERAKKATIGGQLRADFLVLPGKMPMTADWLIALVVEGDPGSRIITLDTREEWRALREELPPRALSWDQAMDWLRGLPDAPAVPRAGGGA
jgi:hypothetical protein